MECTGPSLVGVPGMLKVDRARGALPGLGPALDARGGVLPDSGVVDLNPVRVRSALFSLMVSRSLHSMPPAIAGCRLHCRASIPGKSDHSGSAGPQEGTGHALKQQKVLPAF